jgi:hypothetical protein
MFDSDAFMFCETYTHVRNVLCIVDILDNTRVAPMEMVWANPSSAAATTILLHPSPPLPDEAIGQRLRG